ncbi:sialate O-acetylesterase [Cohnella cholangitidis]|uniref:Sialate O-acetylesterase n=1 Tax=Cohnella cholangitidis TaxID=2598458 RepID=A0A7G5C1P0_9BACL|nr:sialate O-acetylesterase [Cohnella cholangitidis]QMV43124.1 sialate O-acetylesterase [Cohnella cholangitidis]
MKRKLKMMGMFSDRMVLQRDSLVPIWGEGREGETVTVTCSGVSAEAVVKDGKWHANLPPFGAGGPYALTVQSGDETIVFRDVLFGDVWLAGGQSNMEWRLKDTKGGPEEAARASSPIVRFYDVPRISYEDGLEHPAEWKSCTSDHAGEFSAVAYYYANELARSLEVPIGVIGCNWGGTSASCWVPKEALAGNDELHAYIDEFQASLDSVGPEERVTEEKRYHEAVAEFNRRQSAGMVGEELGDYPWPPPVSERSFLRPNGLYCTMIRKVVPYGLKGFIYYQGESDAHKPALYDTLLGTLIRTWRSDWGNSELPFLFVQLPGYAHDGKPRGEEWPLLRESQLIVTEQVPHTAMAVVLDCGEENDIHPRDKKPVGERLALVALRSVYGQDVASSGPVFRKAASAGNKLTIKFDSGAGRLVAANGNIVGFEVAGGDGVYVPASATIVSDDSVQVWNDKVAAPVHARYAWANYPEANLVNSAGLPAGPFRTSRTGRK